MLLGFGACNGGIGDQAKSNQLTLECVAIARPIGEQDATSVAALRQAVETGPLYKAVAVQSAPSECRVRFEDGTTGLEYRFRDGSEVHVSRDERIEFAEHKVQLASPLREDAVALLKRAERAAYGEKGCAIDWQVAEASPRAGAGNGHEDVFYGDTCNCQARVRYDRTKGVVGLTLRSAC
jgi:hypothetical protein